MYIRWFMIKIEKGKGRLKYKSSVLIMVVRWSESWLINVPLKPAMVNGFNISASASHFLEVIQAYNMK